MTAAVGGLGGCPGAAVTEADSCGGALLQRARAASITAMGDQLSVPAGFAVPGGLTPISAIPVRSTSPWLRRARPGGRSVAAGLARRSRSRRVRDEEAPGV